MEPSLVAEARSIGTGFDNLWAIFKAFITYCLLDMECHSIINFTTLEPLFLSTRPSAFCDLRPLHSFGLSARCSNVLELKHPSEALEIFEQNEALPTLVLGGGSNVIFLESFEGQIILQKILGRQCLDQQADRVILRLGAGENWHEVVLWTLQQGWYGLENLVLIPGSVGAAPIQNIGAYGKELKDVLKGVQVWDRHTNTHKSFSVLQCQLGYRDSIFKATPDRYVVLEVDLELTTNPHLNLDYGDVRRVLQDKNIAEPTPLQVAEAIMAIRQRKLPDPKVLGNAGSFFKNPVVSQAQGTKLKERFPELVAYDLGDGQMKLAAGWLIDRLGWRGKRVGGVGVHDAQALVLVNHGQGLGSELLQLAKEIQGSVQETFGVELCAEVNLIGSQGRVSI
jgi:UDP-N-acetylmuramate dehydrogenase